MNDNKLASRAKAHSPMIAEWKFEPEGTLHLPGEDCFYGGFSYANDDYDIEFTIRVENWVFAVERKVGVTSRVYFLCGFHSTGHYTFSGFSPESDNPQERLNHMLGFLLGFVWPILFPELPPVDLSAPAAYRWVPFKDSAQVKEHTLTGGVSRRRFMELLMSATSGV
jgi:hypothetical protein